MRLDSTPARDWKAHVKTLFGMFSLFVVVLILPGPVAAVQTALVRAGDGNVYQIRFPMSSGHNTGDFIDGFSIYDATGQVELCPGNDQKLTRELYTTARVLAETPRHTPLFDTSPLADTLTRTAAGFGIDEEGNVDVIGIVGEIVEEMIVDEFQGQVQAVTDPSLNLGIATINLKTFKIKINVSGPAIIVKPTEFLSRLVGLEIETKWMLYAFSRASTYATTTRHLQAAANLRAEALWDTINAGKVVDIGISTIHEDVFDISKRMSVFDPLRLRLAAGVYRAYAEYVAELGTDLAEHEGPVAILADRISVAIVTEFLLTLSKAQSVLAEKDALDELDDQIPGDIRTRLRANVNSIYNSATSDLTQHGFCDADPDLKFTAIPLTVPEGDTFTYTVALNSAPGFVAVIAISSDNPDVTVSPTSLTFLPNNWNIPKSVVVDVSADADSRDESVSLKHIVVGYGGGMVRNIQFDITDQVSNRAPEVVGTIPDQTLTTGDASVALDLPTYFRDPDDDPLTYTVVSSDLNVAIAQRIGSQLTIWTLNVGTTTVTVGATDPEGLSVEQTFTVTVAAAPVQQPPEAVGTISTQHLTIGVSPNPIDVAPYFSSQSNLRYEVSSSPSGIVSESVSDAQLTLTPIQTGSTHVTVTARDSDNQALSATQTMSVVVQAAEAAYVPVEDNVIVRPPAPPSDSYVPVEDNVIVRPPSSEDETTQPTPPEDLEDPYVPVEDTITIIRPPPSEVPDLIIVDSSMTVDKTTVKPGETFQIEARVWNKGKAVSSATRLRYLLSTDETISSAEDTEVDSDRVDRLSGRGASTSRRRADISKTLTAPDTPGIYYYGVCVDAVADESNTRNNCSEAIRITVEGPSADPATSEDPSLIPRPENPDLVINTARVEKSTVKLGSGFRFYITVENRGMRAAPATTVRYYRSLDATISPEEDTELRAMPIGQIGAGKIEGTWSLLPSPASLGAYYYGACIDGVASEADTSNNCSEVFKITVERQGGGSPQLFPLGTIPTQELEVDDSPIVLDVAGNFVGQVDSWTVVSSHVDVVAAIMWGSKVTLNPRRRGWSLVTIQASRGNLTAKQFFFVSVGGVAVPELEVFIPDSGLRVALRSALKLKPGDALTHQKVRGLTTLSANSRGIRNLAGLEYATQLKTLSLGTNHIGDLTPLENLRNLRDLVLWKNEEIADLTPLQNLTNLTRLALDINKIEDLSPLENLTNLRKLSLGGNQVSSVYPLQNLGQLTDLWLVDNKISDVSALEGLTSLKKLSVRGNPIKNLSPLRRLKQSNPGIYIDVRLGGQAAPSIPMLPDETALLSNYPNPFNPETWIPYQLAAPADVTLTIYDVRGVVVRRLALGHQPMGFYRSRARAAHWDGRNQLGEKVANGLYFYTLTAGTFTATRKMIIRK